jgi:PAS domain S-box-containing protein
MKDKDKTKEQLIRELKELRQRVAELKGRESERDQPGYASDKTNAQLTAIIRAFDGFIYVCSRDYRIEFMNEWLIKRTGYDGTGELCHKILHERDSICPWCVNKRVFRGETVRWEIKSPKDERWYYVVNAPVYNRDGTLSKLALGLDITDQKSAEEILLRRTEEKYRELVENAGSIILRMDNAGNVTFFNEFAEHFFGFSEEEILGRNVVGAIVPEVESTGRDLKKMIEDIGFNPDLHVNNINENIRRNGERVWVAWTNKPIFDEDGRVREVLCIGNDITERKRAEESLEKSEKRYRELYRNLLDGSAVVNMEGSIIEFNPAFQKLLGYAAEEIYSLTYEAITPAKWHAMEKRILEEQVMERGYSDLYEKEYSKKDGTAFPVELRTYLVQDEAGSPQGFWAIVRDITERKRAEQALIQAEEKYRSIFENAVEGIFQVTPEGKFLSANPTLSKMCGFQSPDEMIATITDIGTQLYLNPEDRKKIKVLYEQVGVARNFETQLKRTDGERIWVSINARAVRDERGNMLFYEGTIEDITERKHAEQALRESEERFRKFAEEASFEGIVFHYDGKILDVNETLAKMSGYTRSELIGMDVLELVAPESRPVARTHLQSNQEEAYEVLAVRKDGAKVPVEIHAKLVPYLGKMVRAAAVRDITERKRFAKALQAANQQLMDIIEFLPDATLVIDLQGKVIAWNRAIEEMTGVKKEDILGKGDFAYAIPFYGEPRPILIDLVLKSSIEYADSYDFIERKGNELFAEVFAPNAFKGKGGYIWVTASPLYDREGKLIGAIESIRDISERKEIESALQLREKALEHKTHQLEEMNAALNVLLQKREDDQKELQESVLSNLKEMIVPYLEKVKRSQLTESQRTYIGILETHLNEVLSPFLKNISTKLTNLTPTEIQVASLVKDGKTSKEIAQLLGVAEKTVSGHRYNLRIKLGLKNEKINLRSHLLSLI